MNRSLYCALLILPLAAGCWGDGQGSTPTMARARIEDGRKPMKEEPANREEPTIVMIDREFVEKAAQAGLFEIESSKLALDKNVSPAIREFAQLMIKDHEAAHGELRDIAQRKNLEVPKDLDGENSGRIAELSRVDDQQFERRYREMQVVAHEDAVTLFERGSRELRDPELRAFAVETLPVLEKHLRHIEGEPSPK